MIIESGVKQIIMVCNTEENGRSKCHQYWPSSKSHKLKFTNFSINLTNESLPLKEKDLVERTFNIEFNNKSDNKIEVKQLHYTTWPDHGVPKVEVAYPFFNYMFKEVNENVDAKVPVVVHCSAGIGRTGTFMSSFNVWRKIQNRFNELKNSNSNGKINDSFNFSIFETVRLIKECRCYSVENVNQYNLIYNFLAKHISKLIK